MTYRKTLEDYIMEAWCVTDDLEVLGEAVMESDIDRDQITNVIVGLQQLYQLKFDRLFREYERVIHDRELDPLAEPSAAARYGSLYGTESPETLGGL